MMPGATVVLDGLVAAGKEGTDIRFIELRIRRSDHHYIGPVLQGPECLTAQGVALEAMDFQR